MKGPTSRADVRLAHPALRVALLAVLAAVSAACGDDASRNARSRSVPIATVMFAGEQRGYIEPCGCASPQAGGLLRMSTLLERTEHVRGDVALIQFGGALSGANELTAVAKSSMYADVFSILECNALHVLPDEALLADAASRKAAATGADAIRPCPPGEWAEVLHRGTVEVRSRVTVEDRGAGESEIVRSLVVRIPQPQGTDPPRSREITFTVKFDDLGEAAAKGGAEGGELHLQDRGRAVGVLRIAEVDGVLTWTYRATGLGPEVAIWKSPLLDRVEAAIDVYRSWVETDRVLARVPREAGRPGDPRFVGTPACVSCHPRQHERWLATKHAVAFETLERHLHAWDPECVTCHTVGWRRSDSGEWYGTPGGFESPEGPTGLRDVGCESCHGPASAHVDAAAAWQEGAEPPLSVPVPSPDHGLCVRCHDPDSSPKFEETYVRFYREAIIAACRGSGQ